MGCPAKFQGVDEAMPSALEIRCGASVYEIAKLMNITPVIYGL